MDVTLQNGKQKGQVIPDIADISKFLMKRDEKILEEIIKPKDDLINELYKDKLSMHQELLR